MSKLVKASVTADLPVGEAMVFEAEGKRIALFNVDGTYCAVDDVCPHFGASLAEGTLEGCKVSCPWHGAEFDLTNGTVLRPPATDDLKTYRVEIDGNHIMVEV